jgi:hypothetical protein
MKQLSRISIALLIIGIMNACTFTEKGKRGIGYSVRGGINKGGITENTDLAIIEGAEADAFTGATKTGYHAGARINVPVGSNTLESGMDYLTNRQTLTYNDPVNGFTGDRNIRSYRLMIPVTYNIGMFKRRVSDGMVQLKVGYALQFNHGYKVTDCGENLPAYSLRRWSNGITLGLTITPVVFVNGAKVGFYIDGYRGSRMYTDYYNPANAEIPGSSNFSAGITFHFN